MDPRRFDALTRSLFSDASRRSMLTTLASGLLAMLSLGQSDDAVAKIGKKGQRRGGKKRDGRKGDGRKGNDNKRAKRGGDKKKGGQGQNQQPGADTAATESSGAGDEITTESHGCRHAGAACTKPGQCCTSKCLNGVCSCNAQNPCPTPTKQCQTITCNTRSQCVTKNNPADTVCNDGLRCTIDDKCDGAGKCVGTPKHGRCPSNNPCRPGRCRPNSQNKDANGCVFEPISGGEITCGIGECERTVQQCLSGQEQTCVPGQPSAEVCDGKDNDCDGVVDNGFDLQTDDANCGSCGNDCTPAGKCCAGDCCEGCCGNSECKPGTGNQFCGAGGEVCEDCTPDGACCGGACCDGCCSNGECKPGSGNQFCGTGGEICEDCTPGGTCCGGVCCDGCCSNGECKTGDSDAFCGAGGGVCDTCGNDEFCNAGTCELKCGAGGVCRVFVTSTTQNGKLGGLTGADAICQGLADTALLPGIYKAWLSDDTNQPIDRLPFSTGPYHLVNGTKIADNWDDLTDGDIDAAINRDETGAQASSSLPNAWTNTNFQGGVDNPSAHCSNWSSDSGEHPDGGNSGNIQETGPGWTTGAGNFGCDFELHLYCFQQS